MLRDRANRRYFERVEQTSETAKEAAVPRCYYGEELIQLGEYREGLAQLDLARAALAPDGADGAERAQLEAYAAIAWAALGDEAQSEAATLRAAEGRGLLTRSFQLASQRALLGDALVIRGRLKRAHVEYEQAAGILASVAALNRSMVIETASSRAELLRRSGRHAEALALLRPVLAEAGTTADLASTVALARVRVATLELESQVRGLDAAKVATEALAQGEEDVGKDSPELNELLALTGRVELAQGHRGAALVFLERAVRACEKKPGDRFALAEARFLLAQALAPDAVTLPRARQLAAQALQGLEALPEPVPLPAEVGRWLAAQR